MSLIDKDKINYSELSNPYEAIQCRWLVDKQPTVDAIPVVRCKNCRFSHAVLVSSPHLYYCRYNHKTVDEMDYCSKGENK